MKPFFTPALLIGLLNFPLAANAQDTPTSQSPPVQAQPAQPEATNLAPIASEHTSETKPAPLIIKQLLELRSKGDYEKTIDLTTQAIEAAQSTKAKQELPPGIFFFRAEAEYALGWYEEAKADYNACQGKYLESAKKKLAQLQTIEAVRPALHKEIEQNGKVLFQMYYDSENPISKEIYRVLPKAYSANRQILGIEPPKTTVYIFDNSARSKAFLEARRATETGSWAWAHGGRAGLYFCLEKPTGESVVNTLLRSPSYLHSSVAHELNHAIVARWVGRTNLPSWFKEGLANVVGHSLDDGYPELNDRTIAKLLAAQSLIPPTELEVYEDFIAETESSIISRNGGNRNAPNPYAQGEHMVRFLLANMKNRKQLVDFLNVIREKQLFDAGFESGFGISKTDFYKEWTDFVSGKR